MILSINTNAIDEETSNRITSLRFLLMVFVVLIHACLTADDALNYYNLDFIQPAWIEWFKNFVTGTLGGAAVPLFFFFSSYLQFKKDDCYSVLLKKRARSILLPYVLWTVINIIVFAVAGVMPWTAPFIQSGKSLFWNWNLSDWIQTFTYNCSGFHHPFVAQFWFLRELMIFILLSPVLKFLCKRSVAMIPLLVAIYIFNLSEFFTALTSALFFYMAGFYSAEYNISFFKIADKIKIYEYIVLIALFEILKNIARTNASPVALEIVSCLFFLKLSYFFVRSEKFYRLAEYLAGLSFFLYAVHMPFLQIVIMKLSFKFVPLHGFDCFVQFVAVGGLMILLGTLAGIMLKKVCPPLFGLLTGGRINVVRSR